MQDLPEELPAIARLPPGDRDPADEVWRCCRTCNTEIPPSAHHMAFCNPICKMREMSRQMGMGPDMPQRMLLGGTQRDGRWASVWTGGR